MTMRACRLLRLLMMMTYDEALRRGTAGHNLQPAYIEDSIRIRPQRHPKEKLCWAPLLRPHLSDAGPTPTARRQLRSHCQLKNAIRRPVTLDPVSKSAVPSSPSLPGERPRHRRQGSGERTYTIGLRTSELTRPSWSSSPSTTSMARSVGAGQDTANTGIITSCGL
jgi:hypothetical protein